ncbi:MAG: DNA-directed RNA polymerase subunit beta, partial [Anaerotignum sp.]|nr:DNA-directed RNA polymerase subunit beta [Anaerotignum sp.]
DFPLMTETGTFIINGTERVIVSQLVRSPGIYYASEFDKVGKKLLSSTVIPNRGAWLEYETDSNDVFSVRVDRTRKVPVSVLIRAMGVGSDAEIIELFGEEPKILATLEKDTAKSYEEGLIEIYKKLRPGEPPTVESSASLLNGMFFDPKRYDLAKVGRYKFNKKLALRNRVRDAVLAENVIDPMTGEVVAEEGAVLTMELCDQIQDTGVGYIYITAEDRKVKILTNQVVKIDSYIEEFGLSAEELEINERVYYPMLVKLLEENATAEELKAAIKENIHELLPKHITLEDIFASINYVVHLDYGYGNVDDIDHLGNRRIRSVGELLQNQFRIGLSRMERVVRERMTTQDLAVVTPQALINVRPVTAAIKEFFGSSQLSQFMDQNNPLSELTHKRRLSALGPGGLSRERAGFEVRDVHHSHYGRMCPIETPEGPNIGLINTLSTFARINEYGFIEAPYRKVDHSGDEPRVTDDFIYVTADEEENFNVAQANEPLDENGYFVHKKVTGRYREEIIEVDRHQIHLMDVSPKQMVSVATALIPFLENDDANRALMGSNMQRQAVPLLVTDSPVVGTGMEYKTAKDSGICAIAKVGGIVERVSADEIVVRNDNSQRDVYKLIKYQRSNQSTCLNQKPIVNLGQRVEAGQIIADGASTCKGELALGKNPLIGFMTWEGYNYEDAVLLCEKLVKEDVYTSVHINEFEADARDTKLGPEEITRDIPNVGEDAL